MVHQFRQVIPFWRNVRRRFLYFCPQSVTPFFLESSFSKVPIYHCILVKTRLKTNCDSIFTYKLNYPSSFNHKNKNVKFVRNIR